MKQINHVECQRCKGAYDTRILKFRIQLLWLTYEKCDVCGHWSRHRLVQRKDRSG